MTQEEFDKAPLLDQILYDTTGMLVENHPSIAEAMEKYHQAKLKLLGIADVSGSVLYKGYKITESLQGFDVNVYDGEEWRFLFTKPDIDKCKDFIDRFLKTDR